MPMLRSSSFCALMCVQALAVAGVLLLSGPAWAQDAAAADTPAAAPAEAAPAAPAEAAPAEAAAASSGPTGAEIKVMLDTVWVLIAAFLVFFMNLGFATVESGMCRSKNAVNILSKNFIVFSATTIGFWLLG